MTTSANKMVLNMYIFCLKSAFLGLFLLSSAIAQEAVSKSMEIKKGLILIIKQYGAASAPKYPLNEQPFYGVNLKTPEMLNSDKKYIEDIKKVALEQNKSLSFYAEEALKVGLIAINNSDYSTASKRINQSWLLDNNSFAAYYGFALLVAKRDQDYSYADYLLSFSKEMNNINPVVYHDHALLNMNLKKPDKALEILNIGAKRFGNDYPDYKVLKTKIYISQSNDKLACQTSKEINQDKVNKTYLNSVIALVEKCKSLGM